MSRVGCEGKKAAHGVQDKGGNTVNELQSRIAALVEIHGSLRATARVLDMDSGYLSRLRSGEKNDPGPLLLRRLKLRRVVTVTYEPTDGVQDKGGK